MPALRLSPQVGRPAPSITSRPYFYTPRINTPWSHDSSHSRPPSGSSISLYTMDTPSSERTHIDFTPADVEAKTRQSPSEKEKLSPTVTYASPAINLPLEEDYPDGGLRAWLVVLGCVLFSATTLGWAYVPDSCTSHRIRVDLLLSTPSDVCWAASDGQAREHYGHPSLILRVVVLLGTHFIAGMGRCTDLLPGTHLPQRILYRAQHSG